MGPQRAFQGPERGPGAQGLGQEKRISQIEKPTEDGPQRPAFCVKRRREKLRVEKGQPRGLSPGVLY